MDDALQLSIFNQEKLQGAPVTDAHQDQMIEEQKQAIEEARKVVEREQLLQSEALMKRLAEKRQKNRI